MSKVNFLSVTLSLHHITCYIPYLLTSHHVSNLQSQTQGHSQFLHLLLCTFYFSTQWSPDSTESTSGISLLTLFFHSHGSCLISSPVTCVPTVFWPRWSTQKKHSNTVSVFCKSSPAHQISYHSRSELLRSNASISLQCNFSKLSQPQSAVDT